jgi:two-component system CheB/CheR fusion protein
MVPDDGYKTAEQYRQLLDETEQLRTGLESSLDENARLIDDRDRLLRRVTTLARELQAANAVYTAPPPAEPVLEDVRQSETDEELRVAFEELQVVTEELEVANASLHQTNAQLETRVEERTRELAIALHALRKSEAAFRTLIEGMPQLAWRSRNNGNWTWCSPQWIEYTGQSQQDSHGQGWLLALHPDDRAAAVEAWKEADAEHPLAFECRIFHASEQRYRHFQTRAAPALAPDDTVIEWLGTSTDVDDMHRLRQRQDVLLAELQHRTRNLMGVVQAIVNRTIKRSADLEQFRDRVGARLHALARTQGLLSRRGEAKVTFNDLLTQELAAHVDLAEDGAPAQVTLTGPPDIPLPSSIVQTLSLGLHELATNATKYGALATSEGHLHVQWHVEVREGTPLLGIEWVESGVAAMPEPGAAPVGSGYGRELIESALPYQLGARTTFAFGTDGIRCTIEVPITLERKARAKR